MNYRCLPQNEFTLGDYSITSLREQDIYQVKQWRNEQIDVLRQKEMLTDKSQELYYNRVVKPGFSEETPSQILFSYLYAAECIGYGGFVHISWPDKRAELSFLVNTKRAEQESVYSSDIAAFLTLMKKVAFEHIGFNRIFVETYSSRVSHIRMLEENGFILEGRLREHVFICNTCCDSLIHSILKKEYNEG